MLRGSIAVALDDAASAGVALPAFSSSCAMEIQAAPNFGLIVTARLQLASASASWLRRVFAIQFQNQSSTASEVRKMAKQSILHHFLNSVDQVLIAMQNCMNV